jgi:hypothetical protein
LLAAVVLFGVFILTMDGCNSDGTSTTNSISTRSSILIDGNQTMPAVTAEGDVAEGGEMILWGSGGASRLAYMISSEPMKTHIRQMEAQGFRLSYENCCILEGQAHPPDDDDTLIAMEIYAISMEFPGDTTLAALITHASNPDLGWVVQTQILSAIEREEYEYIDMGEAGIWWKGFMPDYSMNLYSNIPTASKECFTWKAWFKCVLERSVGGCIGAAGGCSRIPPAFVQCFIYSCGGAIVASMVSCALNQLL